MPITWDETQSYLTELAGHSVFDSQAKDPSTEGVREFTRLIQEDPDFVPALIPIRDGITVALRIS